MAEVPRPRRAARAGGLGVFGPVWAQRQQEVSCRARTWRLPAVPALLPPVRRILRRKEAERAEKERKKAEKEAARQRALEEERRRQEEEEARKVGGLRQVAFSCPTGKTCFGPCSAPHSALQRWAGCGHSCPLGGSQRWSSGQRSGQRR